VEHRVIEDRLEPLPHTPPGLRVRGSYVGQRRQQLGRRDLVDGRVPQLLGDVALQRADPFDRDS